MSVQGNSPRLRTHRELQRARGHGTSRVGRARSRCTKRRWRRPFLVARASPVVMPSGGYCGARCGDEPEKEGEGKWVHEDGQLTRSAKSMSGRQEEVGHGSNVDGKLRQWAEKMRSAAAIMVAPARFLRGGGRGSGGGAPRAFARARGGQGRRDSDGRRGGG
jgi:hypothetical protein